MFVCAFFFFLYIKEWKWYSRRTASIRYSNWERITKYRCRNTNVCMLLLISQKY